MITINSDFLKEKISKKKRVPLIGFVLFLVATIGIIVFATNKSKENVPDPVAMGSVIYNTKGDDYVYVDMLGIPYAFAVREDITDKYYIVYDENNYMYILYLDEKTANKLSDESKKDEVKRIVGMTNQTSSEIRNLALDFYNDAMEEDSKILASEFSTYFGEVYLDATREYNDVSYLYVIGALSCIIAIIFIIVYIVRLITIKKTLKKYDPSEWANIEAEVNSTPQDKTNLMITKNYILIFTNGLNVIKISDAVWIYYIAHSYNGVPTNNEVVVWTNEKKRYTISSQNPLSKKGKKSTQELIEEVASRNPKITVGYTQENKKLNKEMYGIRA